MGNVDTKTGFLEGNSTGGIQDPYNLAAERSIESFDVPQRLVLNYSLNLPIGRGQRWMGNAGDGLNRIVSGWRLSGIATFQKGFPLAVTALGNDLSTKFGAGGIRPNAVPGCQTGVSGAAVSKLSKWFNTACFTQPATPFSYGNLPRVDAAVRGAGVNNWDISLAKETAINERVHVIFDTQFLNTFNRTQFGAPGRQLGTAAFGVVTSTINNPREVQFALRVNF